MSFPSTPLDSTLYCRCCCTIYCSVSLDIIGKAIFNYEFGSVTKESPVIQSVYSVLKEAEHRSMTPAPYWQLPLANQVKTSICRKGWRFVPCGISIQCLVPGRVPSNPLLRGRPVPFSDIEKINPLPLICTCDVDFWVLFRAAVVNSVPREMTRNSENNRHEMRFSSN